MVVVYDNDAVGIEKYRETSKLHLPANMRVLRLPDCELLRRFDTIGPNGDSRTDINGCAAAIECYLDLGWKQTEHPVVRWTSYNKSTDSYQGNLESKGLYTRRFLN